VDYKDVNKIYMTISVSGVSQYTPDDITFTPIELWEKEYIYYLQLMKVLYIHLLFHVNYTSYKKY